MNSKPLHQGRYHVTCVPELPMPEVLQVWTDATDRMPMELHSVVRVAGESDAALMQRAQNLAHALNEKRGGDQRVTIQLAHHTHGLPQDPAEVAQEDALFNLKTSLRWARDSPHVGAFAKIQAMRRLNELWGLHDDPVALPVDLAEPDRPGTATH